jgi:hypothetical protein
VVWRLLLIGLALALATGCKKNSSPPPKGGGSGLVKNIKTAVNRTVSDNDLHNLHLILIANDKPPSIQELNASLPRDAPTIWRQVQSGSIVLTGARSRQHIWAYTASPQTVAGEHSVIVSSGIVRMDAATLKQRLAQEQMK